MTDHDLPAFIQSFQALRQVFPLRANPSELEQLQAVYFKSLRSFPIARVLAGAEVWTTRGAKFPKPAEWRRVIPANAVSASLSEFTPAEAAEYRRAVKLHFEDEPCTCVACRAADVTHRLLRYVPDVDGDDRDLKGVIDGQVVVRGHWAHGDELQRWYGARDAFWALYDRTHTKAFPKPPRKHTRAEFDAIVQAEELERAKTVLAQFVDENTP